MMGPYRKSDFVEPDILPQRQSPPTVLAFGIDRDYYELFTILGNVVTKWSVPSVSSEAVPSVEQLPMSVDPQALSLVHERAWLLADQNGTYGVFAPTKSLEQLRTGVGKSMDSPNAFPLWMEGEIRLLVRSEKGISITTADQAHTLSGPYASGPTSRKLLGAVCTVHGPIAIFATDHEDEIDLCAIRGGSVHHRTVSLGHGQSFLCAAGGGTRIAVVSRRNDDVRVRTIASDLRSELNPVPLASSGKVTVGAVRVAHASGAAFVIVHEEVGSSTEIITTVVEDGHARTLRNKSLSLQGLGVSGKQMAVAALTGGCMVPILYVQQVQLARDEAKGETYPAMPRRRVYLLGNPPTVTTQARRALLMDAAEVLAQSLSAQNPREITLAKDDDGANKTLMAFSVPGADAAHDVAVSILLHADGSAIVTAKLGDAKAPAPRPLSFIERARVLTTGDDDGDSKTVRRELRSLSQQIGEMVMSIWTLRLVQ